MDRIAELERKLANLIRFGAIHSVDMPNALVRVQSGNLVTAWLRWMEPSAGDARRWTPPRIGESVALLCPGGDTLLGIVLRGWYRDAYPAPSNNPDLHITVYSDGSQISYNTLDSHLTANLVGTAAVETAGDINVDVGGQLTATVEGDASVHAGGNLDATVDGGGSIDIGANLNATVGGNASINAAGSVSITAADIELSGAVAVAGSITCNGVNIGDTHTHDGVTPGPGSTGMPQ